MGAKTASATKKTSRMAPAKAKRWCVRARQAAEDAEGLAGILGILRYGDDNASERCGAAEC